MAVLRHISQFVNGFDGGLNEKKESEKTEIKLKIDFGWKKFLITNV
jgi:hypothetical protein